MDETKAVARLPNLDIELRHRRVPEEAAEYLSISLRAVPSFRAMEDHLARVAALIRRAMEGDDGQAGAPR